MLNKKLSIIYYESKLAKILVVHIETRFNVQWTLLNGINLGSTITDPINDTINQIPFSNEQASSLDDVTA
jgi:hypothetical protein